MKDIEKVCFIATKIRSCCIYADELKINLFNFILTKKCNIIHEYDISDFLLYKWDK